MIRQFSWQVLPFIQTVVLWRGGSDTGKHVVKLIDSASGEIVDTVVSGGVRECRLAAVELLQFMLGA